ncbi:hypothetical protein TanjilG_04703 [Lupinus angustifolius]|uniref:Membrane-associated kinase regulator 5 n=1 Tax=Lupinus angustifolius TaxID=3871 RepID=A0A4P1RKB5_LUPAN|nr:PREDICTED: probable membrane-associated kinase regulator 5 [Lupinus angustifolius]OIW12539.1 hypothetical protein TanjilG_04703 [Lupinus angustifolius]
MDALSFLKFWKNATISTTTVPDSDEEEEEDSFFDLELNLHHKTDHVPQNKASLSSNEPISKRKILPIDPISKPHSSIALLKSPPSFRLFTFKKRMAPHKTQQQPKPNNGNHFQCSPTLTRVNSTTSFKSKVQSLSEEAEHKTEHVSKDVVQKYLKLIKPFYVRVSKRYNDKIKFSEEVASDSSPFPSPLVGSVSSKKEKQRSFSTGMRGVSKHLGKSRSASAVAGVGSPVNRSDDTLLQQNDGIQSAILHCKRSFNSRDSVDSSVHSVRFSFEDEYGANM